MKKWLILFLVLGHVFHGSAQKAQLFNFESDVRVFTAYAFLNAGGFDHDWLKMDTSRIEIRKYIDKILTDADKQAIKTYIQKTKLGWYECGAYALNLSYPPTFKWLNDSCNKDLKEKFKGLDTFYCQFYEKVKLKDLWKRFKPVFDSLNMSYQPYAQRAMDDIVSFCKIDKDYYASNSESIHFQVCPLMSHWTAFNHKVNKTLNLVQGPEQGNPGPGAFYHEALHPPIGKIITKFKDLTKRMDKLNELAQEKLQGNYPDIISLLNESFVRTIDKYLVGQYYKMDSAKVRKTVEDEYKLGFIFSLYVYETIPFYLDSQETLEEYFPKMLTNLDVEKEVSRWRSFPKDERK